MNLCVYIYISYLSLSLQIISCSCLGNHVVIPPKVKTIEFHNKPPSTIAGVPMGQGPERAKHWWPLRRYNANPIHQLCYHPFDGPVRRFHWFFDGWKLGASNFEWLHPLGKGNQLDNQEKEVIMMKELLKLTVFHSSEILLTSGLVWDRPRIPALCAIHHETITRIYEHERQKVSSSNFNPLYGKHPLPCLLWYS